MTVPEVLAHVRRNRDAETATDPALLEMIETTIQFKPRDQWRPGTQEKPSRELTAHQIHLTLVWTNLWVPPIRNRIGHAWLPGSKAR